MKLKFLIMLISLITIVSLGTVVADDPYSCYVSVNGNDDNDGSQDSPFATLEKAISSVDSSGNSVIYLGEGEFTGTGNQNLKINLDGGNLSIIGQGSENTFINPQFSGPIFNSMSSSSNVELNGIAFINGYALNGGAIQSNANLKISNCLFENNCAYGNAGGAIYWQNYLRNNIVIDNTQFIDNSAPYRGGAVYVFGLSEFNLTNSYFSNNYIVNNFSSGANVYGVSWYSNIVGNTFENTTTTPNSFDGGVYLSTRLNGTIIGNQFINCYNSGSNFGILYLDGNNYLNGNEFINSIADMGQIYNSGIMNVLIDVSNVTVRNLPKDVNLTASITDVDGNIVSGGTVQFYVDNELVNTTDLANSEAIVGYEVSNSTNHEILVSYNNQEGFGCIVVSIKKNSTTRLDYFINSNNTVNLIANVIGDGGNVTFNINGDSFVRVVNNGVASLTTDVLSPGKYDITASYGGSDEYNASYDKLNLTISSNLQYNESFIKLNVLLDKINKNVTLVATCSGNGSVIFTINGISQGVTTSNNRAVLEIGGLEDGNYQVTANYTGNDHYASSINSTNFTISSYSLKSKDYVLYFRNGTRYEVLLTYGNQPVSGEMVTIEINDVPYDVKTDSEGRASLDLNLHPGNYTVVSSFGNVSCSNNVAILPTLIGDDLIKYFRNGSQYSVTVLDGAGHPLNSGKVYFNINGVIYSRLVKNGLATLNINLYAGDYIITVWDDTEAICSNNITVLPIISNNHDLVKYFRNGSQYSVTVLDGQGNPIAGEVVLFNINGVLYERTSNSEGRATLNINLGPGTYIITCYYNDFAVSNEITVKSIIESDNLVMTTENRIPFVARILDEQGNPTIGVVSFNINGMVYERISNEFGLAELDINLAAGDYIITIFYNGLLKSNNILIEDKS